MKKITLYFILFISNIFSQDKIKVEYILDGIKNSSNSLCTDLIIPNEEFSVGIYTLKWIVEDLTEEQCGDIKTDSSKNLKIIKTLMSEKLLNDFYIDIGNKKYKSLNSDKSFEEKEVKLLIVLNFYNGKSNIDKIYVPIKEKKDAKRIVNSICKIFEYKYCFKKFKRLL